MYVSTCSQVRCFVVIHFKMQSCVLRSSAFSTPSMRPAAQGRRSLVVVAVQDVQGTVVSTAMNKTVVVKVERLAEHPDYFKRIRSTKRYFAHDDGTKEISIGDYVRLEGCRPLSKNKRFSVAEIIRKAN
ncbi:hypothetical protein CEUSTIGMA_g8039.t1 [Chlamydomonas eustigma]|uniref:Small ribosomal subunit protein uS17c n=1 Tax=Chlamydomonas eustigma TaxID=1157962 RepID=A0A250XBZ6_9CHLO|nr:hypothetical protein CEUSTIGMA_g8039.t1 [Chlamydomonas eustigma]|eukprot:GAX80604.1 hypothetical protein CEUSTIGMA_g8039.t1 [Chlamydomonas eustigma]